jgi:hypothetical protein
MNAVMMLLTKSKAIREKVYGDIKHHMIAPFAPVLRDN